jgi:hypothetical protein
MGYKSRSNWAPGLNISQEKWNEIFKKEESDDSKCSRGDNLGDEGPNSAIQGEKRTSK